jgi:hypothetical protein
VSNRPLVLVCGLTVGDYLLWIWSLNGNHEVLALVSGLTLPPLALASLWLLAIGAARLLAASGRRSAVRAAARRRRTRLGRTSADGAPVDEQPSSATSAGASSRKLAA